MWRLAIISSLVACGGRSRSDVSSPPPASAASPAKASCARTSPPTTDDLADDPAMSGRFGGPGMPSGGGPPCNVGKTSASFEMSPPISSSPDFDPSQLREVVAAHKDELLRCYTRIACPRQFAYTMNACFTIAASGAVELADSDSVNASLRACTAGVLGSLHFPKPAHPMEVTYRLTFNAK